MKILVSAYACEPGKGSEPEVGLRVVLAAAREHEVWVLTRQNNLPVLERFLANAGLAQRVHVVGIDVPGIPLRLKRVGLPFLHWYYDRWQRHTANVAAVLDSQIDFDLVHHATFATYWTRTGVGSLDKPFVWGPVGGAARTPRELLSTLGAAGLAGEVARISARPALAALNRARRTARKAATVLAQNPQTVAALGSPPNAVVLPNALSVIDDGVNQHDGPREDVIFAGQLVPLKAVTLAVDALAYTQNPDTILHIYGDGPDRRRLERRVAARGVESRVRIHGQVPRERLLSAVASCRVLLHPALHDEASLSVAEALSLGTPVVVLDHAGPAAVAAHWPDEMSRLVTPTTPDTTARELARAVDELLAERSDAEFPKRRFKFDEALLEIYRSAFETSRPSRTV